MVVPPAGTLPGPLVNGAPLVASPGASLGTIGRSSDVCRPGGVLEHDAECEETLAQVVKAQPEALPQNVPDFEAQWQQTLAMWNHDMRQLQQAQERELRELREIERLRALVQMRDGQLAELQQEVADLRLCLGIPQMVGGPDTKAEGLATDPGAEVFAGDGERFETRRQQSEAAGQPQYVVVEVPVEVPQYIVAEVPVEVDESQKTPVQYVVVEVQVGPSGVPAESTEGSQLEADRPAEVDGLHDAAVGPMQNANSIGAQSPRSRRRGVSQDERPSYSSAPGLSATLSPRDNLSSYHSSLWPGLFPGLAVYQTEPLSYVFSQKHESSPALRARPMGIPLDQVLPQGYGSVAMPAQQPAYTTCQAGASQFSSSPPNGLQPPPPMLRHALPLAPKWACGGGGTAAVPAGVVRLPTSQTSLVAVPAAAVPTAVSPAGITPRAAVPTLALPKRMASAPTLVATPALAATPRLVASPRRLG